MGSLRDILVTAIVFGLLPVILFRPYIGILTWSWLGYMNPHRLTWSFAYSFPFAQLVAVVTLVAFLATKDRKGLPITVTSVLWIAFVLWISLTTLVSLDPESSFVAWEKAAKIQLFSFLTIFLITNRQKLQALVWVIALSIGFYGLKGGLYVLRTGGDNRVWGPPGSFIEDNNAMALALIVCLPLLWYLYLSVQKRYAKLALAGVMAASLFSVAGSHSRGAALAVSGMLLFLLIKGRRRGVLLLASLVLVPVVIVTMPQSWHERLGTITSYEEDTSAMGRITAWQFAADMASQRLTGGGFDSFVESNYRRFSPQISEDIEERDGRFQGAHSIYFAVLGEHGFVGLGLYLALALSVYRVASSIITKTRDDPELYWASDLASMLQVSLVGFWIGGAFLGLSYFDLYYHLIAMVIILQRLVAEETQTRTVHETNALSVQTA